MRGKIGAQRCVLFAVTQLPPPQQPPQQPQPTYAHYGPGVPTPPPPAKKKLPTWAVIFGVIALVCCGTTMIGAIVNSINDKATPSNVGNADQPAAQTSVAAPETTQPAAPVTTGPPPPPPPPPGPATSFSTGTYEVGVDIKAGTYTCTAGSPAGYWQRSKDASGELDSIIANGNVQSGAKAIVAVKAKEFFMVNRMECVIR